MNMIDLQGRRAIVTGAAQGIGLSITNRLLESGASVALWDRDGARLEDTCRQLDGTNRVHGVTVDVTDANRVLEAAQDTLDTLCST